MNVLLEDLCSRSVFLAARGKRTYRWAESRFRKNIKRQTQSPPEVMVAGSRVRAVKAR